MIYLFFNNFFIRLGFDVLDKILDENEWRQWLEI